MRICDLSHIAAGRFLRMGPPPQAVVRGGQCATSVITRPLIRHSVRFARTRATFPQGGRLLKQANIRGVRVSADIPQEINCKIVKTAFLQFCGIVKFHN